MKMCSVYLWTILVCFAINFVHGSQPILQKSVETIISDRSQVIHPGSCKFFHATPRQTKMCKRDPGLVKILTVAKNQAITACEENFQYDRWNCSLVYNNKAKRSIFKKIYRETAFIYALVAASVSHAAAKGCASGDLVKCSCAHNFGTNKNLSWQWKRSGCGDDYTYGTKIVRNFLDYKHAGTDQIGEILKQDVTVGIETVGAQMREVCKCHGFSGSCTTKTCWKRLVPFNSAMGLLKKQYHHAVKRKMLNYTTKRAISPNVRKKLKLDRKKLVYLQKTPNLCLGTKGRVCKDRDNCSTLCCGRGYVTKRKSVESRCKCRMVNCCFVKCDTCVEEVNYYTCK